MPLTTTFRQCATHTWTTRRAVSAMSSGFDYDVAVVGASIAGCTAATLLGRAGLRVALIEKHHNPGHYKRMCTHAIQGSAVPTMQRLGLDERVEAAGAERHRFHLWTRWGWIRPDAEAVHGYNLRRKTLDPLLRTMAAETPGVDLMLGSPVRDLLSSGDAVEGVVTGRTEHERRRIRAPLVVGADGHRSAVAELAGAPERQRRNDRVVFFGTFSDIPRPPDNPSRVWLREPQVYYCLPNDEGTTVLAAMVPKHEAELFADDPEARLLEAFDQLPDGPQVGEARLESKIMSYRDYPNRRRAPVPAPGVALIGDAALTGDPLWAIGCGWALQSAGWLVDATTEALQANAGLDAALQDYASAHQRRLVGHWRITSDFSRVRRLNPVERLILPAAAKDEGVAAHFNRFVARRMPAHEFASPRALAKAAWVNLTRHTSGDPRPVAA